ncbi:MAG: outer-membrane lipoprotein carrier protein LolA [Elusimicrobiales bacterium]|nr:outer-membrane lipoprotein carrier protein LolA [Elusimicrobiales bacterium]
MNKILPAILLLAFTLNAAAQQKAAPKKQPAAKKTPAAAAASKPAAAPEAKKEPDQAAEILKKLKDWDDRLETLKADFTQEINFKEAGLKQSIEGTLSYVKPNLLRIEHVKPARQLVVTDKTDIWIYKPEDKQAVRTSWDAWRRTQDQNFSGILDFGNYSALAARNHAVVSGGSDGAPFKITFSPKSGAAYTLTLTLDPADYFPSEAELTVDSTVIKTRLKAPAKNAPVDREIFKFSPPKGVEVLKFKD